MTILEEACNSLIIEKHDPYVIRRFGRDGEIPGVAHEATVLLYSLKVDSFLEDLAKGAELIECSTLKKGRNR
jgi:hypothetical protein